MKFIITDLKLALLCSFTLLNTIKFGVDKRHGFTSGGAEATPFVGMTPS
jgi:hypothetical protein